MIVIGIFWIISAIFVYGFTFAYFQKEWPSIATELYYEDVEVAITMAVFGPIGLLVLLATGSMKHGMKF